jgi:hypothetical protein
MGLGRNSKISNVVGLNAGKIECYLGYQVQST